MRRRPGSLASPLYHCAKPKCTPASLRPAFSHNAVNFLSPLQVRSLMSDVSPGDESIGKDKAAFYKYYLDFKSRPRELQLQPWIPKLHSTIHNAEEGLRVLDDANSSLHDVARALECFVLRHQRHDSKASHEIRGVFNLAKPGQRALIWLLKSGAMGDSAFLEHQTFLKAISHCLVAEDGMKWLRDWLTAHQSPLAPAVKSGDVVIGHSLWRGRLLLHTMEAQAYWTESPLLLEDSLGTFDSITLQASQTRLFVASSLAGRWIEKMIFSPRDAACYLSTPSFDTYLRSIQFWDQRHDFAAFRVARLLLSHPSRRDGTALLSILKHHEHTAHSAVQTFLDPAYPQSHKALFSSLVDLAKLQARQGLLEDAHWVLDFGQKHLPNLFARRNSHITASSKVSWRRKPTESEIAYGLADAQGNWKDTDRKRSDALFPEYRPVFRKPG